MLSSVLKSKTAIYANIEIMRAFVRMRRAATVSERLIEVVGELASKVENHDEAIKRLVSSIAALVTLGRAKPARPIGFTADIDDSRKPRESELARSQ